MKRTTILWMLACILTVSGWATLTSCTNEDNPADEPNSELIKQLAGTWYAQYAAEGTIEFIDAEGDHASSQYTKVVEVYEFLQDGTGLWNRYFLNNSAGTPFAQLGGGSGGLGAFDYSIAGKNISVELTNVAYAPYPDLYAPVARLLTFADGQLEAADINGGSITLAKADEKHEKLFNDWNILLRGGYGGETWNWGQPGDDR